MPSVSHNPSAKWTPNPRKQEESKIEQGQSEAETDSLRKRRSFGAMIFDE